MQVHVDIKILSMPRRRGEVYRGTGVSKDGFDIVDIVIGGENKDGLLAKFRSRFLKLFDVQMFVDRNETKVVKLTGRSKVFVLSAFDVPTNIESGYFNAVEVPMGQILASGSNNMVSVKGVVEMVSPVKEGQNWKRKDVDLKEPGGNKRVRVKLWGDHSGIDVCKNETVVVHNVKTSMFANKVSLNSTLETKVKVMEASSICFCDVLITGYSPSERPVELVTATDNILLIEKEILEEAIGCDVTDFEGKLPYACTVGYFPKSEDVVIKLLPCVSSDETCDGGDNAAKC